MLKKILLPLLLLATTLHISSMEPMVPEIDYESLFSACEQGNLDLVEHIIKNTPNIDINKQDSEGRTPLLCAAYKGKWNIIHYLLQRKANKTIRDNYGQSLFSKMVYCIHNTYHNFHQSLAFYPFDEITQECNTIPLPQDNLDHKEINPLTPDTHDVLAGINSINSKRDDSCTALHDTFLHTQIPIIIKLLNRGACLEQKDDWGDSAYDNLHNNKSPFVIRETLNNGNAAPILLLSGLSYDTNNSLTQNLYPEIIGLIKPLYINTILSSPEARIWKPVCVRGCELANINEADENRCLAKIMMLSQHKKTEINLLLLKEGK